MLINKIGVETDDEVTQLDSRREPADPRNRETTTMLLQVALSAVKRSELLGAAIEAVATPVATLTPAASSTPPPQVTTAGDARTDAA